MGDEEVFLDFPAPRHAVPLITEVRGTVLLSSIMVLKGHGIFPRYLDLLDAPRRERILGITGTTWLPIEVAIEHYTACDALGLERSTIESMGSDTGRFINKTLSGIIRRLSNEAGVTPWAALGQAHLPMSRTWKGGGVSVVKLGPKDARYEWIGQPCAPSPYFRTGFVGFLRGVLTLFCRTAVVRELPKLGTPTSVAYRCSWV